MTKMTKEEAHAFNLEALEEEVRVEEGLPARPPEAKDDVAPGDQTKSDKPA
jgi:hypothetical protein